MSLLLFLCYVLKSYVAALPILELPTYQYIGVAVHDIAPSTPHITCPETRSIWDIVWGCLVTILACTWLSIHPNIPDKDEQYIGSIFRRTKLMIYAFLVPKVVIVWAIRQRIAATRLASKLAKKYEDKIPDVSKEWTIKHGFLLQMGGFMLYENGLPKYTLLPTDFQRLLDNDEIDFPWVHEKDIADRSKGDFFSKGVVLMQTTWFIVQCIARWAQGLGLTELEVLTLALAVLNWAIYALWMHKPLNMQWHVRVNLKATDENNAGGSINQDEVHANSNSRDSKVNEHGAHADSHIDPLTKSSNIPLSTDPSTIYSRYPVWWHNTFQCILSVFVMLFICIAFMTVYPLLAVTKPIGDMMLAIVDDEVEDESNSAPMFYAHDDASGDTRQIAIIGGIIIGSIFGAIHCIAYSFQFPSHTEHSLWRISAIAVTVAPVALGGVMPIELLVTKFPEAPNVVKKSLLTLGAFGILLSSVLYIFARMTLLVLSIISLRAIPTNSLSQVHWISFLPRI